MDSLVCSRAASYSGLKKLGGPGAAPLNWTPGPIVELVDSSRARDGMSGKMNEKGLKDKKAKSKIRAPVSLRTWLALYVRNWMRSYYGTDLTFVLNNVCFLNWIEKNKVLKRNCVLMFNNVPETLSLPKLSLRIFLSVNLHSLLGLKESFFTDEKECSHLNIGHDCCACDCWPGERVSARLPKHACHP